MEIGEQSMANGLCIEERRLYWGLWND